MGEGGGEVVGEVIEGGGEVIKGGGAGLRSGCWGAVGEDGGEAGEGERGACVCRRRGENHDGSGQSARGDGTYPHDLISSMQRTRRCLHAVNNCQIS